MAKEHSVPFHCLPVSNVVISFELTEGEEYKMLIEYYRKGRRFKIAVYGYDTKLCKYSENWQLHTKHKVKFAECTNDVTEEWVEED